MDHRECDQRYNTLLAEKEALEAKYTQLLVENDHLKEDLRSSGGALGGILTTAAVQAGVIERQRQDLIRKDIDINSAKVDGVKAELDAHNKRLEAENAVLREQVKALTVENEELRSRVTELQRQVQTLNSKIKSMEDESKQERARVLKSGKTLVKAQIVYALRVKLAKCVFDDPGMGEQTLEAMEEAARASPETMEKWNAFMKKVDVKEWSKFMQTKCHQRYLLAHPKCHKPATEAFHTCDADCDEPSPGDLKQLFAKSDSVERELFEKLIDMLDSVTRSSTKNSLLEFE